MDRVLIVAHSGWNFLPKRVLFLGAFFFRFKSKLSFRGKEKNLNGGGGFMNPLHSQLLGTKL